MAETPMDIIMKHLSKEHEKITKSWATPAEPSVLAAAIDTELRQNFRIIAPTVPWATDEEVTKADWRSNPMPWEVEDSQRAPVMPPTTTPDWAVDNTIRASGNPMLWYVGTDKKAVRLDDETIPNSQGFPHGREAQIALALVDVSANRLHKVTK